MYDGQDFNHIADSSIAYLVIPKSVRHRIYADTMQSWVRRFPEPSYCWHSRNALECFVGYAQESLCGGGLVASDKLINRYQVVVGRSVFNDLKTHRFRRALARLS